MPKSSLQRARVCALRAQNNKCFYCTVRLTKASRVEPTSCTAEHLLPRGLGDNIVAACKLCNSTRPCESPPDKWGIVTQLFFLAGEWPSSDIAFAIKAACERFLSP